MVAVSTAAQRVDYRRLTEARAERISQALADYFSRERRFPEHLSQLIPQDALYLPGPVIIYGQDWCYESSGVSYRLGYITREHWSDPRLIARTYSEIGAAFDELQVCSEEVAEIIERYPEFPFGYWKEEG
jgi:hypothetical protein